MEKETPRRFKRGVRLLDWLVRPLARLPESIELNPLNWVFAVSPHRPFAVSIRLAEFSAKDESCVSA
jgi:hypothetical protein